MKGTRLAFRSPGRLPASDEHSQCVKMVNGCVHKTGHRVRDLVGIALPVVPSKRTTRLYAPRFAVFHGTLQIIYP
jgi:hypothetical protein